MASRSSSKATAPRPEAARHFAAAGPTPWHCCWAEQILLLTKCMTMVVAFVVVRLLRVVTTLAADVLYQLYSVLQMQFFL